MVRNLDETQKWVQGIGDSLCKIEAWSHHHSGNLEKICLDHVYDLLSLPPKSCNHPGYLKLKVGTILHDLLVPCVALCLLSANFVTKF